MWNDMENTEEYCEKIWKIQKKIVKRYEKYGRKVVFFNKTINTACNLFKFTLCPTVRRNNSVSEGNNCNRGHNSLCGGLTLQ